jgi:SAM-dependent methyltransferase
MTPRGATLATEAVEAARRLLRSEADIAFRRRATTIVDYIDPQPNDRILDAGCGLGFYLVLLSRICSSRLTGLEWDGARLRESLGEEAAVDLVQGDVTAMPLYDESFDKVILSEVIEHLPDDTAGLMETWRVLRPGGVVAITVPNLHYPFLWDPPNFTRERLGLGHFERGFWSGIWTDHQRLYTPNSLGTLVEKCGFDVTDVHLETRYSLPFAHHLVYGVGKFILERNLAGGSKVKPTRRWSLWQEQAQPGLLQMLIRVATIIDRYNKPRYESGPAVSLCLRAVRRS